MGTRASNKDGGPILLGFTSNSRNTRVFKIPQGIRQFQFSGNKTFLDFLLFYKHSTWTPIKPRVVAGSRNEYKKVLLNRFSNLRDIETTLPMNLIEHALLKKQIKKLEIVFGINY